MKNILSKVTAAALAAAIPFSLSLSVCAETASKSSSSSSSSQTKAREDQDMKKALTIVKSRITIPEDCTVFNYNVSSQNGTNNFSFSWKNESGNKGVNVDISGGIIIQYYRYDNSVNRKSKPSFASFSDEQYIAKATKWLEKVNPSMKDALLNQGVIVSLSGDEVILDFGRSYNGIEVRSYDNSATITMDKKTGEVINYYGCWWENAEFKDAKDIVSVDDIKAAYKRDIAIKPWYVFEYDSSGNIKQVNVRYSPSGSRVYDAFTGKKSTMQDDYNKSMNTDDYVNAGAGMDGAVTEECDEEVAEEEVKYSAQEVAAMQELGDMLTTDEIRKVLEKDKYLGLTKKYLLSSSNLGKNSYAECGYAWNLRYKQNNEKVYATINVTADAKSGKVISFYRSYSDASTKDAKNIVVKEVNSIAKEAGKYYLGDKFGEYLADTSNTKPSVATKDYTETIRNLYFYRYVNNIQVSGNSVNISVNSNGDVMSFNYTYTDADFGDGKILSKAKIYEKLFEQKEFLLYYDGFTDLASKPHTYLCYEMPSWNINGVTGKLCNWDGSAIKERTDDTECTYTDIGGTPYENEIKTLYRYGVKLSGSDGKFLPKSSMTVSEFRQLLSRVSSGSYYYYEEPVEEEVEEVVEDGTNAMKRSEMAKLFAQTLVSDEVAMLKGIYKSPFKDVSDSRSDIGYIAIAYAMGAITADSDGKFRPDDIVTREYAMHVIYTYIYNMSKA
ncbi:MAG: S-layer homology domain-containing protein [Huintestinicola sp.]